MGETVLEARGRGVGGGLLPQRKRRRGRAEKEEKERKRMTGDILFCSSGGGASTATDRSLVQISTHRVWKLT